jgi:hypothetical protein
VLLEADEGGADLGGTAELDHRFAHCAVFQVQEGG